MSGEPRRIEPHLITVMEIDENKLHTYSDERLAEAWRVAEAGGERAGDLVEHLQREIVRRWLRGVPDDDTGGTTMTDQRTERLQALAQRQVPAQVKLIGAQRSGDTTAEQEARAELDDIARELDNIKREIGIDHD